MGDFAGQSGVKPIIGSAIAWSELIKYIAELTGQSPTSSVDSYGYKLSDYASFVSSVGEFRTGKIQNPLITIQNANDILNHLHFGFLIYGKSSLIFVILEQTDLKITTAKIKNGRVAIVTGTLGQWKQAVISILSNKTTGEARQIFSYCYDFFQSIGLQSVWAEYRKKQTGPNMYLLEYKK